MSGIGAPPPPPPGPAAYDDPGLRDLRGLRLGSAFCLVALLAINAIYVYAALLRATGARGSFGAFLYLLFYGHLAAGAFAAVGLMFGAGAAARRARLGARVAVVTPLTALVVAFATPGTLVVALGEASSSSWWSVYAAFLPASLLLGAQIALLEPAGTVRGTAVRPLLLFLVASMGAVGPIVSMLALFFESRFGSAGGLGLFLSALGAACDAAVVVWVVREERRRRTAPWPAVSQTPA